MNLLTRSISIIFAFAAIVSFISAFINPAYAESGELTTPDPEGSILFVLDTCPHCQALLEELATLDLTSFQYTVVEISGDENRAIASQAVEICQISNPAVPLLFNENECYVGRYDVSTQIKLLAGLSVEENTDPPQIEEDSTLINAESPTGEVADETANTDEDDGSSLAERLGAEENDPITPLVGVMMLLAPLVFIGISVYLLRKFKL